MIKVEITSDRRGEGKTVLLSIIKRHLESLGWAVDIEPSAFHYRDVVSDLQKTGLMEFEPRSVLVKERADSREVEMTDVRTAILRTTKE